jgi:hypothetical protein
MTIRARRRMLKIALAAAGGQLLPWRGVFAQGPGALVRAPRQALVIGNGRYRLSPLRNPGNDASGMAAALRDAGFQVTLALDLGRSAMQEAMRAYAENLARSQAVGLFYFAGHGVQLAWRNYLLPVDADIASSEELRQHAVDVTSLVDGIRRAGNPMNLIILDACRDNPFGSAARVEHRGLSQMDAPPGTLLAYATAPGNTAIDGDGGDHGLYTEHLLREIRVPEARVEDVFKRVRLGVRRRSRGMQIPWESTSLEEDFWFIPPREIRKRAEEEVEREFRQELALWESIRHAAQPEPLEDYLRRYPDGRFTELAQLQLDRVLARLGEQKIAVVSVPGNPYAKGSASTDTRHKVGDSYSYRQTDLMTGEELRNVRRRITAITDTEVIYNKGVLVTDLLGNTLRHPGGAVWSPNQTVPTEFAVGRRWNTRFRIIPSKGGDSVVDLNMRIAERERITVPAGVFNAFRVEAQGWQIGEADGTRFNHHWNWKTWYSPQEVRQLVAWEWTVRGGMGRTHLALRSVLVAYQQA